MTRVRNTKLSSQEKNFKKEHKEIYDAFFHVLENKKKEEDSQEKQSKDSKKEVFAFLLDNLDNIFNSVSAKVRLRSEENFYQFLLSLFQAISAQDLSNYNSDNSKIKQTVTKCINDAHRAEVWDMFVNYVKHMIPAREWLKKIPGLEEFFSVKEEKETPKSDTEMVVNIFFKVFTPIIIFVILLLPIKVIVSLFILPITALLLFCSIDSLMNTDNSVIDSVTPFILAIALPLLFFGIDLFGTGSLINLSPWTIVPLMGSIILATYKAVNDLFSNVKEGTVYNPNSQQEQKQDWKEKFCQGIDDILNPTAKEIEKSPATFMDGEIIIGNNAEYQRA